MKKTQIELIKKARKEGASEDVLALLSRENFTVRTLTDLYNMTKGGKSVTDIKEVISMDNIYCDLYWRLNLLKDGYTPDEIRRVCDMMDYYSVKDYDALNAFSKIIDSKTKNEVDVSLRIEYARFYAEYSEEYVNKGFDSPFEKNMTAISSYQINFAIANNIPVDVFKQEYGAYKDGYAWMYNRLPGFEHLLQGATKRSSTNWEIKMTSMSSDEIKAFTDVARKFYTNNSTVIFNGKPSYGMEVALSAQAINIKLAYSSNTRLYVLRDDPVCCNSVRKDTELVVFYSGDVYVSKNKRFFPLSMKEIGKMYERYGKLGNRICNFLFTYTKEKLNAPVMTDFYRTLQADGFLNVPIGFNECRDMHNCNQLLKYRWKNASIINWNKADINVAYAIMKSLPVVRDIDQRRLLQHTGDKKLLSAAKNFLCLRQDKNVVELFLMEYIICYTNILNEISDYRLEGTFTDYCFLCEKMHVKISLGFKTYKKLVEAHDKAYKRELKRLHRVFVPKNSGFNELRKLLPKNFEWIKGGKRLQQEGVTMSHCVNSYYSDINRDKIAIYHLTMLDGYKATIEFERMNDGRYRIAQMYGYHNNECPEEVWDYVYGFLKDSTKKRRKA